MSGKQQNSENSKGIPYKYCLNCGSELCGMYCHVCGQQATSPVPTIKDFIMEYLNNAFLWDPKFFQTLWTLICRPGRLTVEYLSGKFISQEHPLKFNMFLLFVFVSLFLFFSDTERLGNSVHSIMSNETVFPGLQMQMITNDEYSEKMKSCPRDTVLLLAPLNLAEDFPEYITNIRTIKDTKGKSLDKWTAVLPKALIEDGIIISGTNGYYRFNKKAEAGTMEKEILYTAWKQMVEFITQYFPIIVLLTVPFLALSLAFVQRKQKCPHINHLIFSLHYTAFLEFLIILIYLLYLIAAPPVGVLEWILLIGSNVYLVMAFRRGYNTTSWLKTVIKVLFTNVIYLIICLSIFIVCFFSVIIHATFSFFYSLEGL